MMMSYLPLLCLRYGLDVGHDIWLCSLISEYLLSLNCFFTAYLIERRD